MTKIELLLEAERRGILPPDKVALLAEARRRGLLQGGAVAPQQKERPGFWGSLMESAQTLGLADEAAAFAANPTEENRRKLLAAGESKFESVGGFGKGENWEAFKELLGGSLGQLVAPAAAATGASFVGTPLAGLAAGYGTATAQYTAQNLLRQAQEQERALAEGRTPEETSALKAAGAGAASAGLDYVQFRVFRNLAEKFPFVKNLVASEKEVQEKAAERLIQAAREGTLKNTARGTVEGAAKGVAFEVPQEVAQTALERWQAGLDLTGAEAAEEYKQAAIGAAILGPTMGGAAGAIGARAERRKAVELEEKDFQRNIEAVAGAPDVSGAGIPAAELAEYTKPKPLVEQPPKVKAEDASIEARQEPLNLSPKQVQEQIADMEAKQQIRANMLSDLDALKERIEGIGGDYETGIQRLTSNFDTTATRLDIFRKHLEGLSKPPEETPVTPVAPIPQTAAAQQTIQIDQAVAQGLGLPGAETAPKDQPFTVSTGPVAPIPQVAGAQQALGLPSMEAPPAAPPIQTAATPVAPIPQAMGAQQALPIQPTQTVEEPLYRQAVEVVLQTGEPTVSAIQNALKINYMRAARFLERMQLEGIVTGVDKATGRRTITMGQPREAPSATAEAAPRLAEQAQLEPVGGGVGVPPSGPEPTGRVAEVPADEGLGAAPRVAGDVVAREGAVKPALKEKTLEELEAEIAALDRAEQERNARREEVKNFARASAENAIASQGNYSDLQDSIDSNRENIRDTLNEGVFGKDAVDFESEAFAVFDAEVERLRKRPAKKDLIERIREDAVGKTADDLFNEIENVKTQLLGLLTKNGRLPAKGSAKRKKYDELLDDKEVLTKQWIRQSSKEQKKDVAPSGLQPMPDLQGVDLNDLGNAVGKAIKALPPLANNVRDAIRNILDLNTTTDNVRRGVYAFLSLYQQSQLFAKELPALKGLLRIINSRAGALKARREVLDRNVRRWSRIIRENNTKMEEFFTVANESSRLQVDFKNPSKEDLTDPKRVRLLERFNALPKDLRQIYFEMLKSYSDMADEYINLVTKNVSESAAKEFRAAMAQKRLNIYLPLYREGDYWLRYQDANNETVVRAFETNAAREKAKEEAARQRATGFQEFGRIEDVYEPGAVGPFFDKVVKELEAKGISKEVGNALYSLYLDQIPASSVRQQFRKREGVLGYENNLIKVYSTVASRMANQLTNLEYVPEIDKAHAEVLEEAKVQTAQAKNRSIEVLMDNLQAQMDYIRNPVNSSFVNGLSTFSYYWYIIGNVSTAVINTTQIPMVVFPYLAGRFPGKAGDALTKAKDIYLAGGWDNDIEGEKRSIADWSFGVGLKAGTPLARLYNIAVEQSAIRRSSGYDVVQGRQEKYTESDYVGKKVFIEQSLGWVFQNSERFNREVTLIAAFNLELEKNGGDVNAAAQYAIDVVNDTHGSVLNETSPRAFQTGVGKVFFIFKNFAQTQIFLQYRLLREVLKGADRETQKVAAKQFAGIMGMSFLFAGVQGMPLYGAASVLAGLLEEAFGDEDNPVDPDEYLRQAIGSLAYKGPVSQALQVDIASRTGFNNLLWREDDKRIEEIGPFLYAAEQIFGASYAVGMNFYRAWNDFWDGHTDRALEAATPAMIRNGLKAWRFASEGAKTRDGQEIVKDFSPYNTAMQALGFSPLEFAEKTTAAGKIAAQKSALEKRKKSVYDKIYLAYKNGNEEDFADALAARDKFNKSPAVIEQRLLIKDEDIRRSIRDRERRAAQSIYGIYVPPKSAAAYEKYKPEGYDGT